jgi:hypothetical protein
LSGLGDELLAVGKILGVGDDEEGDGLGPDDRFMTIGIMIPMRAVRPPVHQ